MNRCLAFAALAAFCFFISTASGQKNAKITIDLYYGSRDSDCTRFMTKQLAPSYPHFKDYLNINFIPFGVATFEEGDEYHPTFWTCLNGQSECYGNKMHACAIYEIEQTVKADQQLQKKIDYFSCLMTNPYENILAQMHCAKTHGLNVGSVTACTRSYFGEKLAIAYGRKTNAYERPLWDLPTILINGIKTQEALDDFAAVICQLIPDSKKLSICK